MGRNGQADQAVVPRRPLEFTREFKVYLGLKREGGLYGAQSSGRSGCPAAQAA